MDGAENLQALAPRSREAASSSEKIQEGGPGIASRLKKSARLLKLTLSWQTEEGSRSVLRPSDGC